MKVEPDLSQRERMKIGTETESTQQYFKNFKNIFTVLPENVNLSSAPTTAPPTDRSHVAHESAMQVSTNVPNDEVCNNQNTYLSVISSKAAAYMGSFAILIPLNLRVSSKAKGAGNDSVWELAQSSSKRVINMLDNDARRSTFHWQVISGFISRISRKESSLKTFGQISSNRPSAILISNAGKWDVKPVELFIYMVHQLFDEKTQHSNITHLPDDNYYCIKRRESKRGRSDTEICKEQCLCRRCHQFENDIMHKSISLPEISLSNNMQKYASNPKFSISIESSWSVVAQHIAGVNYFAHNVTTIDERICWSLQYHSNLVSNELAAAYAHQILEVIQELCPESEGASNEEYCEKKWKDNGILVGKDINNSNRHSLRRK